MAVAKKNIFLSNTVEPLSYVSKGAGGNKNIPADRDYKVHATVLESALNEAITSSNCKAATTYLKDGVYLEFSSKPSFILTTKSLENIKQGIRLLNVRYDNETKTSFATVYIPTGKEQYFIKILREYKESEISEEKKSARHQELVNSIENIKLAMIDAFWTDNRDKIPAEDLVWCELWLRVDGDDFEKASENFADYCNKLNIDCDKREIRFPERLVKLVYANAKNLGDLIEACSYIAEMRSAPQTASFFEDLSTREKIDWSNDLLDRIDFDFSNASVCILDTGVTSGHPLLSKAIEKETEQAVESDWKTNDPDGHGTAMAGIALYNNLQEILASDKKKTIVHRIESVKILPPAGANRPELYGAITNEAVYLAEYRKPDANRAICMAVTDDKDTTGSGNPTSWSGAIDSVIFGKNEINKINVKRLFFISAGNIQPQHMVSESAYPGSNLARTVQNPGQSWNAITVGAYTDFIRVNDAFFKDFHAVADSGEISPYSSTSNLWDKKWPIKPEILFEGGNMVTDGERFDSCSDLSLLTTSNNVSIKYFTTINGTSSATAQAAYMAAQIMEEYPEIWPETVRALMIHSARWTKKMLTQFCKDQTKKDKLALLRCCGYGIPDLSRAIECMNNRVNLVIEAEIQPFDGDSMKEMHIHEVPWPVEILKGLGEMEAEMRVTLSYFIEPGPGEIGWKDKYRYPSCGLRFDVNNKNEKRDDFLKRINVKMRGEDIKDSGSGSSGSEYWHFGPNIRNVGSIHSDYRSQNAVDLCEAKFIAVYPVVGWWRERKNLNRACSKIRYSLIVSISTPNENVDLYTEVMATIKGQVKVKSPVSIGIET
ncbi:MAG: S8 family peptidase [Clostridiales bacterium]|jgi:hypothetical protein|nr:S8 family peptidase [Clostridiales bacterium]